MSAARFDIGVVLSRWKQDHPDVAISTAIVAGDPDAQLIRWSKTAAVLVVGRPHEHRWGSWTRSVARTVMRQTHCPLIVAPWAAGGAWAASGAGRSGADLNVELSRGITITSLGSISWLPSEVRAIAIASRGAPATSQP